MKKMLCAVVMSIFVLIGHANMPAYATTTDVNIVPPPPPSMPEKVTVSAITDITAQVSWPAVTSALQYNVYLNEEVYSGSNSPQVSLTGLAPHTNYEIYLVANNSGGDSPPSETVRFKTLSLIPIEPSVPMVTTTGTTAKLLWQPLTSNYNIIRYTVYIDGESNKTVQTQAGMQTTTLNNLTAGNHTVAISATNDNREGPQSEPVTFKISTVQAPSGVQFYNKSEDTVWINWRPVPGASSYNISINNQQVGQTYQPFYIIQDLTPETSYQISVVTVMPDGEQSQSTNSSVQTEPLAPAMTVTSLQSKMFTYITDLKVYIEILFAILAALMISNSLKITLRRR